MKELWYSAFMLEPSPLYPESWPEYQALKKEKERNRLWVPIKRFVDDHLTAIKRRIFYDNSVNIYYIQHVMSKTCQMAKCPKLQKDIPEFLINLETQAEDHKENFFVPICDMLTNEYSCYKYASKLGFLTPEHHSFALENRISRNRKNKKEYDLTVSCALAISEISGIKVADIESDDRISKDRKWHLMRDAFNSAIVVGTTYGDKDRAELSNIILRDFDQENPNLYYHYDFEYARDVFPEDVIRNTRRVAAEYQRKHSMDELIDWNFAYNELEIASKKLIENKSYIQPQDYSYFADNISRGLSYINQKHIL